jgi:hypothetical protein
MTSTDWIAIISAAAGALVAIIGAIGAVWVQVRKTHELVNGKMEQLLAVTRSASFAAGQKQGGTEVPPHSNASDNC